MRPFKYTPPRIQAGELRTEVEFSILVKSDDFMPSKGKEKTDKLYKCMAKIEGVWSKDIVVAKADGTLSDLTISIRDTHGEFIPTNKMLVEIFAPEYDGVIFQIKHVMPDLQNRGFIKIIAEVKS